MNRRLDAMSRYAIGPSRNRHRAGCGSTFNGNAPAIGIPRSDLIGADALKAIAKEYGRIRVPVNLIYGEYDGSRPGEREANLSAIPEAGMTTVRGGGHFLSLDAPETLVRLILDATGRRTETDPPAPSEGIRRYG